MRTSFILAIAVCISSVAFGDETNTNSKETNVLLIVSEDGGLQFGCYGDHTVPTPNVDKLANEGMRFENAFVTQAGCSPSRASILTGMYPHQHGQIGLATHRFRMFDREIPNLPSILAANGYRTGCIGKVHVNPEDAFKFDYKPEFTSFNAGRRRDVRAVAEHAGKFFRETQRPFFLMVNYADTHLPWRAQVNGLPENPLNKNSKVNPLPFVGLTSDAAIASTANYYNCISRLDAGIGLLLDELERAGRHENTLVIYLSDHGPEMPRGKMTCYEGGVRVPLVVRFPGRIAGAQVCSQLVSAIDLLPTILDMCAVAPPKELPGRSLRSLFINPDGPHREYLFSEFTVHWPETYFPQRAVRDKQYKLIANLLAPRANGVCQYYRAERAKFNFDDREQSDAVAEPAVRNAFAVFEAPPQVELYDLSCDPHERHNLADLPEHAHTVRRLSDELKRWQVDSGDELRHSELLKRLSEEIASSFTDGVYGNVQQIKGFKWHYPKYLNPQRN